MANEITHAIYQPGQLHVRTSAHTRADGSICPHYVDFDHAADYIAHLNEIRDPALPAFELLEWREAIRRINAVQDAQLIHPWSETTEERFDEMLNILPPEKWQHVGGVELFRMCEYYTDNITTHFAQFNGRYFEGQFRTSTPYTELAAQVRQASLVSA